MTDDITNEDWDRIEARVLKNIPLKMVSNEKEFKHALSALFFQEKGENEWNFGQAKMERVLWDELGDLYEAPKRKEPSYINIDLKAYPKETKRFMFAITNYKGIFRFFNRGYTRTNITNYYAHKTKRKPSTVNRDISALVKMGIIQRQGKGRYKAKEEAFA